MHAVARRRHEHSRRRLAAALVLAAGLTLLLPAHGAEAHSSLESSTPASGGQVAVMPARIALTFTAEVRDVGVVIALVDERGTDWTAGSADVDAALVTSPVAPGASDGRYEIRWDVISSDGAPMSGVVRFAVGTAGDDLDPLDIVLTAEDAFRVLLGALGVVGALLAYLVHGLIRVYGGALRSDGSSR